MSGSPTKGEVDTQWKAAIDIIETMRNLVDGTLAGGGGKFDTLLVALEGEYTPAELAAFVNGFRGGCSELLTPGVASSVITPILFEYGKLMAAEASGAYGSAYRSPSELFAAVFDYFHSKGYTVKSRAITYDTTATTGHIGGPTPGTIVGNGTISRLTVDEYAYNLEACHVERKVFRCRSDQNTGTEKNAEVFEVLGQQSSFDSVLRGSSGSGESNRTTIVSKNAGTGSGGSLLANSSFSEYSASASPKFRGWTETAGGANIAQNVVTYYRTHPGAQTDASLQFTGGGGTITLKQTMSAMRIRRLDANVPYFIRVMVKEGAVAPSGGNITLRLGNQSVSIAAGTLVGAGWTELTLPLNKELWPRNFAEDPFDVELEWSSSTSGTVLFDDMLFCPMDLIDGTYWVIRGKATTHIPWLQDDTLEFTDTGGAPSSAKLQWWTFVSGYGYLPSSGSPTITDP